MFRRRSRRPDVPAVAGGRRTVGDLASGSAVEPPDAPVAPASVPPRAHLRRREGLDVLPFHPPDPRHLNRELSWLQFDDRVLAVAEDPDLPLLERVRFLAISASNLDEFTQVRVAGLHEQRRAGASGSNADGLSPAEQLDAIRSLVGSLCVRQVGLLRDELLPALEAEGIELVDHDDATPAERDHLARLFDERIFPVLTPLAVDPAHPFPYISNLSLSLAVMLEDVGGSRRFARVKVPPVLPRFLRLPASTRFVPLETVIAAHLGRLFPGVRVVEHHGFRVTRNADLDVEEDEADDLLAAIRSELDRRRFGRVVRLEVEPGVTEEVLTLLRRELEVDAADVVMTPSPLGLADLVALTDLERSDLLAPPFVPVTPGALAHAPGERPDVLAAVRAGDVLVHHPYDSFSASVQAFLEQAALDPDVLAIKVTLYRTSGSRSPIIRALLDAARAGKQVVALIELKARFDEEANIVRAQTLEEAGVHVAYGVVGLKTHTKIALVVRREADGVRRYVHIGTGNYNDQTARIYEDLGLLSCDPRLAADLSDLFNVLTGYGHQREYRRLVVAPTGFRTHVMAAIAREAAEPDGSIVAKVNSLVDPEVIEALYAASAAGTRVELLVRGICCLRPQVPGLSDNVTVRSIVGRYLEHSRVYRFGSPARGHEWLIGSGDLMPRNLDRRVEALVPIDDPALTARLEDLLDAERRDDLLAWELGPDARWRRVEPRIGIDAHATLQERARRRAAEALEPHP